MNARGITIVGASAGSGKTFRLTQEVTTALSAGVDVTGLVAVTFTRKAHAELEARIRQKLVGDAAYEDALRLPLAYIGTVHAVALRLLQELAIEAGLSPNVDVVSGNETKLLREAFERTLNAETRADLDALAAAVELRLDGRLARTDWVTPCTDIMDLARSNRIPPDSLPAMAARSSERLLALLPRPMPDGEVLDEALRRELDAAATALARGRDDRSNTAQAIETIAAARIKLDDGELPWSGWAKLATLAPSKKCDAYVADLRLAASRYEEHPRFHADITALTHAVFDAARLGLVAYQAWKRERRVVDYVDMLDSALSLLDDDRVCRELASRLRFLVVDEFQDTSPIQLALFLRLHAITNRSVWVGDRKQCIFEYAGADPTLMDAVADWIAHAGGALDRLEHNHRSRRELVELSSELFAAALAPHGFTRRDVAVSARRDLAPALAPLPPLGAWVLESANKSEDAEAIAEGIRRMLEAPHTTPVIDRANGEARAVRPGDIAVLTATNDWALMLARALHARGVRASIARAGLFDTPEGTLADAALRWMVDGNDDLAAAIIDALTGFAAAGPDAWLAARIDAVSSGARPPPTEGWRAALDRLKGRIAFLAPAEALDVALDALDVIQLCARWPDPVQRIANLDALRAMAAGYEARCAQERQAATIAGLLRYFDDVRSPTLQRDEMLTADDQHVPTDDGAIVVCTYHKSKGLEWPVVILANLERGERRSAFEVTPETFGSGFDPEHPLVGRAIRYWPWPLGAIKNAPLAKRAAQSAEGRAVALREERERIRLLYVGFTRARDHLVLAVRSERGRAKNAWLDSLAASDGSPIVRLPITADDYAVTDTILRTGQEPEPRFATRVWRLRPTRSERSADERLPSWFERANAKADQRPAYRIVPSADISDWPELTARVSRARVGRSERFDGGSGIRFLTRTSAYDVVGNVIHGFLAADTDGLSEAARLNTARRLIVGWGLDPILHAEGLLHAGDALRRWVARRWPGAKWYREITLEGPIASPSGERWLSGIVDLLLETDDAYILIDHKSFPAPIESAWRAKCATFIPQLAAYALILDAVGPKKVSECWVHLPVGGAMVRIELPQA